MLFIRYFLGVLSACVLVLAQDDMYAYDSNVYELSPSNFDKVVLKSNYTTIVKFYAPWCGYCVKLAPAFHKLGKFIHKDGQLAINVAAVNCDREVNKPLCARYKVQGFPSLLVFRPAKYEGTPTNSKKNHAVETYTGDRNLKSMVSFLNSRLKNYVKKFSNPKVDALRDWFTEHQSKEKILFVSPNQQTSPLLKSIAIDFLGNVKFAMLTMKDAVDSIEIRDGTTVELPPIKDLPALLYYDETNSKFVKYDVTKKLNDKKKISKWIIDLTGQEAIEGPLSKKDINYNAFYRRGIKPFKKANKEKKKKVVEHDEL